jgi:hypothetical protein
MKRFRPLAYSTPSLTAVNCRHQIAIELKEPPDADSRGRAV